MNADAELQKYKNKISKLYSRTLFYKKIEKEYKSYFESNPLPSGATFGDIIEDFLQHHQCSDDFDASYLVSYWGDYFEHLLYLISKLQRKTFRLLGTLHENSMYEIIKNEPLSKIKFKCAVCELPEKGKIRKLFIGNFLYCKLPRALIFDYENQNSLICHSCMITEIENLFNINKHKNVKRAS